MRAISLWQPWASAVAAGIKTIETRHWETKYRGPLAIHAALRWTPNERKQWHDFVEEPSRVENRDAFRQIGIHNAKDLPFGCIVATCELYACVSTDADPMLVVPEHVGSPTEIDWGNYSPGRFGWFLRNVKPVEVPAPVTGRQGFFEWNP